MPILASTMVMPELIPVTYAKIRAELAAEIGAGESAADLVIVGAGTHMLVDAAGRLPQAVPRADEPIWRAAIREAEEHGASEVELLGWAGDRHVGSGRSALILRAALHEDTALAAGYRFAPVKELLTGNDAQLVRTALQYQDQFACC
jgi:hypothetical protein